MHNNKLKRMENLSKEVWKDIRGYESRYQVSNMGNVRNLHFHSKNLTTKELFTSSAWLIYLYVASFATKA